MTGLQIAGLIILWIAIVCLGLRSTVVAQRIIDECNRSAPADQQIPPFGNWNYWRAVGLLRSSQPGSPLLREHRRLILAFAFIFLAAVSVAVLG